MKLIINGDEKDIAAATLGELVEQLGIKPDRVAIELNYNITRREEWAGTTLNPGDKLEIVHFVGGGNALANCRTAELPN